MKKEIQYYGKMVTVSCDEKCNKAWGINARPFEQLSDDIDDVVYLADDELEDAPMSGIIEGGDSKPVDANGDTITSVIPNKWCVRECERCYMNGRGSDFSKRVFNKVECQ